MARVNAFSSSLCFYLLLHTLIEIEKQKQNSDQIRRGQGIQSGCRSVYQSAICLFGFVQFLAFQQGHEHPYHAVRKDIRVFPSNGNEEGRIQKSIDRLIRVCVCLSVCSVLLCSASSIKSLFLFGVQLSVSLQVLT